MFIRALIFFFGLLMLSTGISVITHAGLGTGTISSVALVLSKALPLSMGFFVFLTNVFFFVLQTAVDPSRFLVKLVKQIPICFVFGLFFDAATSLSCLLLGSIEGVREGTLVAAVCGGQFAKVFLKVLGRLFPAHRPVD